MALITSYPKITTSSINSDDLLMVSQDSPTGETLTMSIGQITNFIINSGAAGSSENQDYVDLLKTNLTFDGGIMSIEGYYNTSETANLLNDKASALVVNELEGRLTTAQNDITSNDYKFSNLDQKYTRYVNETAYHTEISNNKIDSNFNRIGQLAIDQEVTMRRFNNYSSSYVTNNLINSKFEENEAAIISTQSMIADETSARVTQYDAIVAKTDTNKASIETNAGAIVGAYHARTYQNNVLTAKTAEHEASIEENQKAFTDIDGKMNALYSLKVTAGKNVAGMKLGADEDTSFVSFLADSFKIHNGTESETPFEVVNGQVKIKSAAISSIQIGQVDGAPDQFNTVTTVFAENQAGYNASTTRGTRNFIAWYTNTVEWTPSIGVLELEFQAIQGERGVVGPRGLPGEQGNPGTPGVPGEAGQSVTIKGSKDSVSDLTDLISTSSPGDGWIVGNDLHVYVGGGIWNNVGVVRGPQGEQGEPGEDGIGTDGFDGKNGDYVSYIYIVSETAPGPPSTYNGSFDGFQEVVPSGNWTDIPSADIDDTEWMSTRRYKNNKTRNADGSYTETWTGGNWSTPARIYQRGERGGTPKRNIDFFDGNDGSFTSFIFKTTSDGTPPTPPVGGEYNGVREIFPTDPSGDWFDEPTADETDTEWVSKTRYTSVKSYDTDGIQTTTWTNNGWSTPSRIYQKGDTGLRGPIGRRGTDGTSVTIKGAVESVDDLPQGDHSSGDSYLIGGVLWVWSELQKKFVETGSIQGPGGETGAPGIKGDPGEDGFNGNDGIYTSFVYKVSDTLPSAPQHGSFDGTTEVYPTSDGTTWTDSPSVDDEDIEWRSMVKYKNNKYIDNDGTERSDWTKINDWSQPVKIYQKGLPGDTGQTGNSVNIKGSVDSTSDLPTSNNQLGDCYLINGVLFVYDGNPDFIEAGSIKGEKGDNGDTPEKFRDYYDGNDGAFTSFIFRVTSDDSAPFTPTDGSYNGSSEIIPNDWSDEPLTGDHDIQWTSTRKYSHNARTGIWSSSNWSAPIKYTQKGDRGPVGPKGVDGTSVTILEELDSTDDLPASSTNPENGDGYLIAGNLWVWNAVQDQFLDVGTIQGPPGAPGASITGEKGDTGEDGIDGDDGIYTSFVYKVQDTKPNRPTSSTGSFNGTTEVMPDSDTSTPWTDNPSVSTQDVEWRSSMKYKNTKSVDVDGNKLSVWTKVTEHWSEPAKIFQKGLVGDTGTSITMKGSKSSTSLLPLNTDNHTNAKGDSYMVGSVMYTWTGNLWDDVGDFEGPPGVDGTTPEKGRDYYDGNKGQLTSFIFRVSENQPSTPSGGSYNGSIEVFPQYWTDDPKANEDEKEWVSTGKYNHDAITDIWSFGGWSTPKVWYKQGDKGDVGDIGLPGRRGADGTSITMKQAIESFSDLPTENNSSGDGYIIDGILWVWSDTLEEFVETGNVRGPGGETGAPGEDGSRGEDGFDGNDGIYTSFVYRVSDTLPSTPQHGSFNGAVEVYPTSNGVTWTDSPSVNDEDVEWRSTVKYKNNKYIDSEGAKQSDWTKIGDWSTPVKIYQKGLPGNAGQDGNSVNIKGSVNSTSDLPTSGNQLGDCYLINGVLFVYNGDPDFIEAGNIKGDKGDNGDTPQKFRDYYDGNDGSFTSFIFRVTSDNTAPAAPTDGSYSGSSEIIPSNWSDEPIAGDHDVQWTCTRKYSHNAQTGVWSGSNWSTPVKYIQKGDRGPIGPRGVDGTSVTILEELNSTDDLPASSTNPTNGDGYLINGNLWVWNTVQNQFLDVGSIQGPQGAPGASITGAPGDTGEDGLDGNDGIYTSFVYKVQDTQPNRPTSGTGSFDGAIEVMPNSDTSTPWTDNPSVSTEDVEWRSSMKYKNTKSVNSNGDKLSVWTKVTEHWSEPAKIYQKGLVGDTGTSITMKGSISSVSLLPLNTPYHTNAKGDSYMVGSIMYTWTGNLWDDVGDFEGPPGVNGTTPLKGRDYYNGDKGQLTSFIFRVSNNQPNTPSGGSYNGSVETFPQYWTDDPKANEDEKEWVSVGKYNHNAVLDTWSFDGWSTPKVWYKQGGKGDKGDKGDKPQRGVDYDDGIDGNNVRVEYSVNGVSGWTTIQQGNVTYRYIRTAVDSNNDGIYIAGPVSKFVPEFGVEYRNGRDGVSSYVHIKYSNDGVNFTSNNGEDVGKYMGTYADSNSNDSNDFDDYNFVKIAGDNGAKGDSGLKTKTGIVWYKYGARLNPGIASAHGYDFVNNEISELHSYWSTTPPRMEAGTSSNLYWTAEYDVLENASDPSSSTITFGPTTNAFGFDQVVTFNSLSDDTNTVIHGGNITTGIIKSSNYNPPHTNAKNKGFAMAGMGVDLNDGSIHAEQFYVNSDGSAGFGGSIKLRAPATSSRGAQTIELAPDYGKITISHASKTIPYTWGGKDYTYKTSSGTLDLDSEGMFVVNEGQNCYSATEGNDSKASIIALARGNSYTPLVYDPYPEPGTRFVTAIYAKATNSVGNVEEEYLHEPLGAVVEDLRADGFVSRIYNIPHLNHLQVHTLKDNYVTYISYFSQRKATCYLELPLNPKTGQIVEIVRTNYLSFDSSGYVQVRSTRTSSTPGANKTIRAFDKWHADINVKRGERFIFQGDYWLLTRFTD